MDVADFVAYLYFRFTPADLLNHFRQNNIKLGMVVDFTNTYRYYDGKVCMIKLKTNFDISVGYFKRQLISKYHCKMFLIHVASDNSTNAGITVSNDLNSLALSNQNTCSKQQRIKNIFIPLGAPSWQWNRLLQDKMCWKRNTK